MTLRRRFAYHASAEQLAERVLLSGQKIAYVVAGIGGRDYPVEVVNNLVQAGYTVHTPWWNSTDPANDNPAPDPKNPGKVTPYVNYKDSNPGSFQVSEGVGQPSPVTVAMDLGAPNTPDRFVKAVVADLETHDSGDTVVLIGHGLGGESVLEVAKQIAVDEALGKTTVKIDLLATLDPAGYLDAASNPGVVQGLLDGSAISSLIKPPSPISVKTQFSNGQNGQPIPVNDAGKIPGYRAGLTPVASSVGSFYNRWQINAVLPFDYPTDGTITSAARYPLHANLGIADQALSNQTTTHLCTTIDVLYGFCRVTDQTTTTHLDANYPAEPTIQSDLTRIISQLGPPPQNFVVTTTMDLVNGVPAKGSLRAAILGANRHPGPDQIAFDIVPRQLIETIRLDTTLPGISDPVSIDATTQPGYQGRPVVVVDGSTTTGDGLFVKVGQTTIKGLVIGGFKDAGIHLAGGTGYVIENNLIGTDATGSAPLGNTIGILIDGRTSALIGGTAAGSRNTLSGNARAGIFLNGAAVQNVRIIGNFIGTDLTGKVAVTRSGSSNPLASLQNTGIAIVDSRGNTIGGAGAGESNVISGNLVGITIAGQSASNSIVGNLIGTDAGGSKPLSNIVGIYLNKTSGNRVGGVLPGERNVISGNTQAGVDILGPAGGSNSLQGNLIGPAADGTSALRDSSGGFIQQVGVYLEDASGNLIGGTTPGAGNTISGNFSAGVFIASRVATATGNSIVGNSIGVGLANLGYGVLLANAPNNQVIFSGAGANSLGVNGVGNVRNYQGVLDASAGQATAARQSSKASAHKHVVPMGPKRHIHAKASARHAPVQ